MRHIINFKIVIKIIIRNLLIISVALFICSGIALFYSEDIMPFILTTVISILTIILFYFLIPKHLEKEQLNRKDAYFAVTFSWLVIGLIGCLPYILSGTIPSFINAFFESVSGFTTTGSSILVDIEALPKSILFWRSLTHWIGGIGIIVLVIIIMPSLQIGGYHLFTLESSMREKILPRIKNAGYRLLLIYIILTIAEIILLLAGNMNIFESVCHAFGTIATGGFSPKNASITNYSPYIQYVIMMFMILAGTNYIIHYRAIKRDFAKIRRNEEFKLYLFVLISIGILITGILFFTMEKTLEESFRLSFFQVISIITCTGYATTDYMQWPVFAWVIIFFAMFIGGSSGSTSGGIKIVRHLVLLKNVKNVFRRLLSPNAVIPIKLNSKSLNNETNNSIITFVVIYFMIFVIGSILLILAGTDITTAGSSVATCMAGIGPGIGSVGPSGNFAHIPEVGKMVLTLLMLIGRLEIYPIIILFSRNFWTV